MRHVLVYPDMFSAHGVHLIQLCVSSPYHRLLFVCRLRIARPCPLGKEVANCYLHRLLPFSLILALLSDLVPAFMVGGCLFATTMGHV